MERIKNIDEIIIGEGGILVDLIKINRKSGIILDEKLTDKQTKDYGIIISVGTAIKDLQPGDIVVRLRTDTALAYEYKNRKILLLSRYSITIAVKASNFDLTEELIA